jgi:S1-C subfamily serine protease
MSLHTFPGLRAACLATLLSLAAVAASGASTDPAVPADAASSAISNSVVRVFATVRAPDLSKPWTKQAPTDISGSGVVIDGHRILTNAHLVLYASQVQIQANGSGDKIAATVIAVAPGIDLALLKIDDESVFDTHAPLPRASTLPQIKDAVLAYGYPTGGTSLSITKGIVSRIDYAAYNFPVMGLRVQIDAAINPGNSGGPAVVGNRMIGLSFSRAGGNTQNVGYIIPNEEIELFLQDIGDGHYDGKPALYDELQTLENPALRSYLNLDKSVSGVVVHHPYSSEASYPLKEWDVITRIGESPVDDQGMVKLNQDLRVSFLYRVQQTVQDGKVPLTIVRNGKSLRVQLPVSAARPLLMPPLSGEYPSYFICGPLVFTRASPQFLSAMSGSNVAVLLTMGFLGSPLLTGLGAAPDAAHDELVLVSSPFFPSSVSIGYQDPRGLVVDTVNGTHIRSLKHLVSVLRDLKDPFVVIAFATRMYQSLVFSRSELLAATDGILSDNGIRAQGSADMMAVWQASPGATP